MRTITPPVDNCPDCGVAKTSCHCHDIARLEGEGGPPLPEREPVKLAFEDPRLPLKAPKAPLLMKDEHMRIAFLPEDTKRPMVALALNFEGEDSAIANASLLPGTMQIDIASGFGKTRMLQLTPAEFMLLVTYGDRFFAELPRG